MATAAEFRDLLGKNINSLMKNICFIQVILLNITLSWDHQILINHQKSVKSHSKLNGFIANPEDIFLIWRKIIVEGESTSRSYQILFVFLDIFVFDSKQPTAGNKEMDNLANHSRKTKDRLHKLSYQHKVYSNHACSGHNLPI